MVVPRHGPPRDRRLHQLEGARGEEGARADRRAATRPTSTARPTTPSAGQNSNNSVRVTDDFMQAVAGRRQVADHVPHHRRGLETLRAPRTSGGRSPRPPGPAPIPGVQYDSTINRWHTCPNTGRINASNPCSEYMFLDDTACNLASLNLMKFLRRATAQLRRRGLPARLPRLLHGAGDPGRLLVATRPSDIAQNSPRLPPARASATPTSARCSCCMGSPTTATRARACAGALTAIMTRRGLRAQRRDGRQPRAPFAGFAQEPRADAARHAHAPRRGATRSTATSCPRDALARGVRGLGRRRRASASSTATATRRPRCSRRPGTIGLLDGLRHDRHRARLRARQVQEARRRRLLQDRQPVGARRAATPRLRASRDRRRSSRYVSGHEHARSARRTSTARRCKARGLTDEELAKVEAALPGVVRPRASPSRPGSSARRPTTRLGVTDGRAREARASTCSGTSASPTRRSRRPTT